MKSEFTSLLDMVIARGGVHSDLITEIHQAVLTQFRQRYPKRPPGVAVVVDETNGEVRIYSGEKDITPEEFVHEANSIARKVLIEKLDQAPARPPATAASFGEIKQELVRKTSSAGNWIANIFFWGYNLYFLLFVLAMEANWLGRLFRGRFFENLKNLDWLQAFLGILMLAVPVSAMVLAVRRKLYSKPGNLGRIFFLFEIPVLAICLLAGTTSGQATAFVQYVILTLITIPPIIFFHTSDIDISLIGKKVLLFLQQQALVIGGYLVLLFSLLVPLILGGFGREMFSGMFEFNNYSNYGFGYSYYQPDLLAILFGFGFRLLGFGVVVFLVSVPYLLMYLLVRAWRKNYADLEQKMTSEKLFKLQAIFLAVVVLISTATAIQFNNNKQLDLMTKIYESRDLSEQESLVRQLLPQEKKLANTIKNFRNVGSRYLFDKDDKSIGNAYEEVFGVVDGSLIQGIFTNLAYPFVYQGKETNSYELERQYQFIFGHPSYETTTVQPTNAARNVNMMYRKFTVITESNGLAAKISVDEQYKNQSGSEQEIIYEFTLPEGSVVTELNLGPDLEFPGVIAAKGAAQRVYEAQLQIRRDPALLEQIGPNQYRLRVFPIPRKNDFATLKGRLQRVQFAYVTPLTREGFGLPEYQKATNMLADGSTSYLLERDGKQERLDGNIKFIAGSADACAGDLSSTTNLSGLGWRLSTNAGLGCQEPDKILDRLSGKNIALIIDISAANRGAKAVGEAKALFGKNDFLTRNTVDLYKFNQISGGATKLTPDNLDKDLDVVYFGTQNWGTGLPKLTVKYDLILVVTTAKTDLSKVTNFPFRPEARIYIIGDKILPAFAHQLTAGLIQSGGGMKTSLTEAMTDAVIKTEAVSPISRTGAEAINNYLVMKPVTVNELADPLEFVNPTASGSANIYQSLANQVLFKTQLGNSLTAQTDDVKVMDEYGEFAKAAGMVTPFSSYVALVNQVQKQQLEQFENSYNRYQEQSMTTRTGQNQNITLPSVMPDPAFDGDVVPDFGPISGMMGNGITGGVQMLEIAPLGEIGSVSMDGGGISKSMRNPGVSYSRIGTFSLPGLLSGNSFMTLNLVALGIGSAWYLVRLVRKTRIRK